MGNGEIVRLVIWDVDGTILNPLGEFSPVHHVDVTRAGRTRRGPTEIAGKEGVRLGAVLAVGDSSSDVPLFREVGQSVAMGQWDAEVKRAASRLTRSNSDNGFARAVEYAMGRTRLTSSVTSAEEKG